LLTPVVLFGKNHAVAAVGFPSFDFVKIVTLVIVTSVVLAGGCGCANRAVVRRITAEVRRSPGFAKYAPIFKPMLGKTGEHLLRRPLREWKDADQPRMSTFNLDTGNLVGLGGVSALGFEIEVRSQFQ